MLSSVLLYSCCVNLFQEEEADGGIIDRAVGKIPPLTSPPPHPQPRSFGAIDQRRSRCVAGVVRYLRGTVGGSLELYPPGGIRILARLRFRGV